MKYLFFTILFIPNLLFGQLQIADFQTTIYVEDAFGNIDSVIIGYDATETPSQINPNFGEVDMTNVLWDSVFEVRLISSEIYVPTYQLKNLIEFSDCDSVNNQHSIIYTVGVKTKIYDSPFTISWKSEDFAEQCRSGTGLAESIIPLLLLPQVDFINVRLNENGDSSSILWTELYGNWDYQAVDEAGDSAYLRTFIFVIQNGIPTRTSTLELNQQTKVFPNPINDFFTIELPENQYSENLRIVDVAGRTIYESVEKSNQIKVVSSDWTKGIYFYQIRLENGILVRGKILKN